MRTKMIKTVIKYPNDPIVTAFCRNVNCDIELIRKYPRINYNWSIITSRMTIEDIVNNLDLPWDSIAYCLVPQREELEKVRSRMV
jgi:hypothetical protein